MNGLVRVIVTAGGLLVAAPALGQGWPLAGGVNLGTTGLGAELQAQVAPSWVLRGDADWLGFSRDETYSNVPYRGRARSATAGAFVDWHPAQGPFVIALGGYFGDRKLRLSAAPSGNVVIGGRNFTPDQVGRLDGEVKLSAAQPFAGVGFDNTFTHTSGWGVRGMAGVAFSDAPKVSLRATGGAFAGTPALQAALQEEEASIRRDTRRYRYYPILQLGVTRRF